MNLENLVETNLINANLRNIDWIYINDRIMQFVGAALYDKFVTLLEVACRVRSYDSDISFIINELITFGTKFTNPQRCSFILRLMKLRSDNSVCSRHLLSILKLCGGIYYLDTDTVVAMMSHRSMRDHLFEQCGWVSAHRMKKSPEATLFYFDCVVKVYASDIMRFWQPWISMSQVRKKYRQFALFAARNTDIARLNRHDSIERLCVMLEEYLYKDMQSWRQESEVGIIVEILEIFIARGLNIFTRTHTRHIYWLLRHSCYRRLNDLVDAFSD